LGIVWGLFGVVGCSVNQTGLSTSNGGSSGRGGGAGTAAGAGGSAAGRGGMGGAAGLTGGAGASGGANATGAAGTTGADANGGAGASGGTGASGAAGATGGLGASGGDSGLTGGGASGGSGATGGTSGSGGDGVGGSGDTGGASGGSGRAGGGRSGHGPDCSSFPAGSSTTLSSDGRLHCYWTHSEPLDWTSSESACVGEGGTLATILSQQENSFVADLLTQTGLFVGSGVSLGASDGKMSNDMSGVGTYAWVTGEPWGYTNWHTNPTQPDGSCTTCINCGCDHWLAMIADGTWFDRPEITPRPFVCEAMAR
jgi:hypothetical protein